MNNDNDIMRIAQVASKFWTDKITFLNLNNEKDIPDNMDSLLLQTKLQSVLMVANEKMCFEL